MPIPHPEHPEGELVEPLRGWPHAPHDPRERVLIDRMGEWQVRQFAPADPRMEFFPRHQMLHLQLWHSEAEVSVLTPSRLTDFYVEVYPIAGARWRTKCWCCAARMVRPLLGAALPPPDDLREQILRHIKPLLATQCGPSPLST